ncbi:hypothetical protein MAR_003793 [Mya arenaria]|uniref:CARD domain-containing protein n=1 Tax=Mya arenaria TaxID=6604 RepID=A0ABY7EYV1_MYAAR|nr:uncharacterized protein LOC128245330 [Mya arenaria]WAR13688.1 hypothetical protein MAR_003793 [Mya arenaria]
MDEQQIYRLRENRVKIVNDLEPRGRVLDILFEEGILTENDVELVSSARTRKERCHALLSVLPTRGPVAYGSFQKALNAGNYEFLATQLSIENDELTPEAEFGSSTTNDELGISQNRRRHRNNEGTGKCASCLKYFTEIENSATLSNSALFTIIEQHCCLLLDNIEPKDLIDHLFQEHILTADDIDTVCSCLTRRQRCELLFCLLLAKDHDVVTSLKRSLTKKYSYIVQTIEPRCEQQEVSTTDELANSTESHGRERRYKSHRTRVKEYFGCEQTDVKQLREVQGIETDVTDGSKAVDTAISHETPLSVVKKCHNERKIDKSDKAKSEQVCKQVTFIHTEKPKKRLVVAFNYLSTLINQGEYTKFEDTTTQLRVRFPRNYDLLCILGYLQASRDLFKTDFDSAKRRINDTMALVPKTSNPRYFTLELFTAKTRMYITQKKLEKLQTTLEEAMMILETDPLGCTGRAAGWLYINHARNMTAQLSCLNLSKPGAFNVYNGIFNTAKTSFQRSMTNFKRDGGKDGPFGFGYALCRLVILLLRCGDNGRTMGLIKPPDDDVISAEKYMRHLEDSDIPIPKILEMHSRLAKCDYFFHRNHFTRAFEHATEAHNLATTMNLLEFTEHAHNRMSFLNSKQTLTGPDEDISEEDVHRILFEDSTSEGETNIKE